MILFRQKIAYGIGNTGLAIVNIVVQTWLLFFLAPGNGRILIPASVVGAVWLFGRIVDAVSDPLVSTWSDRYKSKLGRRIPFLLYTGIPLAAVMILLFFEPVYAGALWMKTLILALLLGLFYFLFTAWAVPYNALVADLSPESGERIDLATSAAVFNLIGTGAAMILAGKLIEVFRSPGVAATEFQMESYLPAMVILGFAAAVAFYGCAAGLYRLRHRGEESCDMHLFDAMRTVFKNRPFLFYVVGMNIFWGGFIIINVSVPYYITILMGEGEGFTSIALGVTFGVSLLFFPVMNRLPKVIGKRFTVMGCTALMGLALLLIYFIPAPPFGLAPRDFGLVVMGIAGIPIAGLFIVPNAMVADLSDFRLPDGTKPGVAIYYGVQGLINKMMVGVVTVLAGVLFDVFGNTPGHYTGIILTGPVGAVFAFFALFMFTRYPDDRKGLYRNGGGD
ncbi:MAG: MFS transporter [Spirochaetes bacterium]|nr:MFS transporter [Spirochaetota bacterium]